jgi:hypothetical protein
VPECGHEKDRLVVIRLTEVRRDGDEVELRAEGSLSEEALEVLQAELARYREGGVVLACLNCDGLTVSPRRLVDHRWPDGLRVEWVTTRPSQYDLLEGHGLTITLRPNAAIDGEKPHES